VFQGDSPPYGVDVWKDIRKGWAGFTHFVCYKVGNGFKLLFCFGMMCCVGNYL
jgi:hypothetical protein